MYRHLCRYMCGYETQFGKLVHTCRETSVHCSGPRITADTSHRDPYFNMSVQMCADVRADTRTDTDTWQAAHSSGSQTSADASQRESRGLRRNGCSQANGLSALAVEIKRMAWSRKQTTRSSCYSYGPMKLWAYIVMALHS